MSSRDHPAAPPLHVIDLSDDPDDEDPRLQPVHMCVGQYAMTPAYLESCLRPGQWLHDDVISAMVYLLCGRERSAFVDSQSLAFWLTKRARGDAPPGIVAPRLPRFLIVNDSGVHWYVIHVEEWTQTLTAYGAWTVSAELRAHLRDWLGPLWRTIALVSTPETGDPARDAALRSSECGVAVCRAVADLIQGQTPRAPLDNDRQWILRTIRLGARTRA